MTVDIRTTAARPSRIRKARWAHHKADWRAFQEEWEAVLTGAEPARTVREAATLLTIQLAATRHIPKGARRGPVHGLSTQIFKKLFGPGKKRERSVQKTRRVGRPGSRPNSMQPASKRKSVGSNSENLCVPPLIAQQALKEYPKP